MSLRRSVIAVSILAVAVGGCSREGELVLNQGVGVTAVRSVCPAVGIPDYTGDITVFGAGSDKTVSNLDITATMTNVRSTCDDKAEQIYSEARFDVLATRSDTRGARTVSLPYFSVVMRGGSSVQAKRIGTVNVQFADGESRAQAQGRAAVYVDRASATLPDDVRKQITRKRKPGDTDAALDPLADPQVRSALQRVTFEFLIGFQLSEDQLAYNVTR